MQATLDAILERTRRRPARRILRRGVAAWHRAGCRSRRGGCGAALAARGRVLRVARRRTSGAATARQLRAAFEELGPAWIKLGQMISVRPDLFPAEWVFELGALQDNVAPLPARRSGGSSRASSATRPRSCSRPSTTRRSRRRRSPRCIEPCSRASIGRSSGIAAPAGTALAVKVVRPGVEESILGDIAGGAAGDRAAREVRRRAAVQPAGAARGVLGVACQRVRPAQRGAHGRPLRLRLPRRRARDGAARRLAADIEASA